MGDGPAAPEPGVSALGDAADRLILDEAAGLLSEAGPGSVVVIDDVDGALTLGAIAAGATGVRVHQDLITGTGTLDRHAESAGATDAFTSLPLDAELLDGARLVLLRLPKSLDRLAEVTETIAAYADPSVTVVAGGRIKYMSTSMNKVLHTVFDRVDVSHARQKSRVLIATGAQSALAGVMLARWPQQERHDGLGVTLTAHGGVFAGTRVDIGTQLLIEQLAQAPEVGSVVDLACGNGIIGTTLARHNPQLRVIATDRSATAVASARATAEINGVADRIEVRRVDGLAGIPDSSQEFVTLNPPFHDQAAVSTGIARELFSEAARVLVPGGELWCVWNSHLRYRPLLEKVVGPTRQLARNTKFTVTASTAR